MDSKIKRIYVPMTETGFYILFCLQKPQHGYGIGQMVKEMTDAMAANQAYSANVTAFNTLKQVAAKGLEIGR